MARLHFTPNQPVLGRHLDSVQDATQESLRQIRLALGPGQVFYGLEVYPSRDNAVQIRPGLAFDLHGNALALRYPIRVPLPARLDRPHILAVRWRPSTEEPPGTGDVPLENDGVEVVWVVQMAEDDSAVPLATARPDSRGRIVVESDIAPRATALNHRHSGEAIMGPGGYLRYDGPPVVLPHERPAVSHADLNVALSALRHELLQQIEQVRRDERGGEDAAALQSGWEPELELIHGLGRRSAAQLEEVGVRTVPQLLEWVRSPSGRAELSQRTGIAPGYLERWGHFADLMRLHGVTPDHVRLLLDAGFESVAAVAAADPAVVNDRIREVFRPERHQLAKVPPVPLVRAWVHEARGVAPIDFEHDPPP